MFDTEDLSSSRCCQTTCAQKLEVGFKNEEENEGGNEGKDGRGKREDDADQRVMERGERKRGWR
jgi:hypothetical protein